MKDWICEVCKNPIAGDGSIEIFNTNPEYGTVGGYPRRPSPDEQPGTDTDAYAVATDPDVATAAEISDAQTQGALWLLNRQINIGIRAVHATCAGENNAYSFSTPPTIDDYMAWVLHIDIDKNWMGRYDMMHLVYYWWWGHGEHLPEL